MWVVDEHERLPQLGLDPLGNDAGDMDPRLRRCSSDRG